MIRVLVLLFVLFSTSYGGDFIPSQGIRDGQTVVSADGSFVLGFFSPGNSINRYLGIWFAVSNETVVWVANRDKPLINDSTGVLQFDATGNLVIKNKTNVTFWTSGSTPAKNSVARLLDTGNLVLFADIASTSKAWESFNYPTDTMLANMRVGPDHNARRNRSLTSWRSAEDPASGDFTFTMDPRGLGQPVLYNKGSLIYRSGPWNGSLFSGTPEMASYVDKFSFTVENNENETYYEFRITKPGIIARLTVNSTTGKVERLVWDRTTSTWNSYWFAPKDQCDNYAFCGTFGVCDANKAPICDCLYGFQPENPAEWDARNWKGGCKRRTELNCSSSSTSDGFKLVTQAKLPDTVNSTVDKSLGLEECRGMCLRNCSCTAFAIANISGAGSGCIMWTGDLVDIKVFTANGQDLYLRLADSELDKARSSKKTILAVVIAVLALISVLLVTACIWRNRKRKQLTVEEGRRIQSVMSSKKGFGNDEPSLPLFDLDIMASATDHFSDKNKIGRGGFGIVYRGVLNDGREVAVKRLCTHSGQGADEFMTEVLLIAKLQHRNLVRLLGYCIQGEERMLVYEYMPNGSLDTFIFGDTKRRRLLDWRKRLDIVLGIARGLVYLHQDSRLRVIHRDLKAGNVLLDGAMNPKISDFGTARIFVNDQTDENTDRIVGTIGYMSPEYAMDGNFSDKSDVFSFGVLVLEIISGRKNRWISQTRTNMNLLAHAWRIWTEDRCMELVDDTLRGPCPYEGVLKCLQVGLLCVQESLAERPTMQRVVLMLGSDSPAQLLPQPKKPGFFNPAAPEDTMFHGRKLSGSVDMFTLTDVEGR